MKKRIITSVIGACVIASVLAGCSDNKGTGETAQASLIGGGQTQISVEVSQSAAVDGYKFSYMGYDIVFWTPAAPILKVLGEPTEMFSDFACAGEGMATVYSYPEFDFYTSGEDENEIIDGIKISNPLIDCGGVHVGDKVEVAKSVYGDPVQEDDFGLKYVKGNTHIWVITDGADTIVEINYGREIANGAV